ncbi:MAG: sensor histidine kinase [Planctomycetota bacterium]|jgi:signal transduction histidine kinase
MRDSTEPTAASSRPYEALMADVAIAEQMRIGRDLHDTVGQHLAALALSAERASREVDCQPGAEALAELATGIRTALASVRAAARGLTRVAHDASSLFVALEELATLTRTNHGIDCRLVVNSPGSLSDEVADHLHRIASEAVGNAAHHAQPTSIEIGLMWDDGRLTLFVADDGIGMPEYPTRRGIGTWIMRSRAAAIGADFEIGRGAAGGTVVSCTLHRTDDEHGR